MFEQLKHKIRYKIYRYKYNYAHILNHRVPVDVSLELASMCNQRCGYCYHADQKNVPFKLGIMKLDIATKIITEAAELGVNSLKFNQKGESTLNPHFYDITSLAKSLAGGSTFIDRLTNSNFKFNSEREDIFKGLCNQTKVKVSLDSFNAEVMHTQRAGSIHSLTMANIDKFYNYPNRKDTRLVIQAVRTKLNENEDIYGEVKRRWPSAEVSIRDYVSGRLVGSEDKFETVTLKDRERQTCIQAHGRLILNYEGKALVCCPDIAEKLVIGDVRENSLYHIFNSTKAQEIRRDLKSGNAFKNDPCKTCSSHESYKGYKANADS